MSELVVGRRPVIVVGCRQPAAFRQAHRWALAQGYASLLLAPIDWPYAAKLVQRFSGRAVLTDETAAFKDCAVPVRDVNALSPSATHALEEYQGTIAILLTSGSTGEPQPIIKDARAIRGECSLLQALWRSLPDLRHVISTVACEHMFGYTFGFWLPRLAGATLHAQRTLTPADLRQACAASPVAPWIVCTPTHLRAYVQSREPFGPVAGLICATSALNTELARVASHRFEAPILEIYGNTECGAIASRVRTADEVTPPPWRPLPGVRLDLNAPGDARCALPHVDGIVELGDLIDGDAEGFHLLGRRGDMVKVCGKRHSLAALNELLLQTPGVHDGAYYVPDSDGSGAAERATAFVVLTPGHGPQDVLMGLRGRMDDVFLPRPLMVVKTLPRTEAGKLRANDLLHLHRTIGCHDDRSHTKGS